MSTFSEGIRFDTQLIRAGVGPDPVTGAVLVPVHQNTTYLQDGIGRDRGFTYSRCGNPTVAALEARLGALEGAPPAIAFGTGMAATTTLFLSLLQAGDRVIVGEVVYGGTVRVLQEVLEKFGVIAEFVDTAHPALLEAALRTPAKLVFVESPANPTMKLTDLREAARLAHAAGALLVVDNTFLTPALQRPLDLGADLTITATTKFIEGHTSTVGGSIVARDEDLLERIRFVRNTAGTIQAPW
jgi:cystathionine beta-lyase/cystathionine gamma-synthase